MITEDNPCIIDVDPKMYMLQKEFDVCITDITRDDLEKMMINGKHYLAETSDDPVSDANGILYGECNRPFVNLMVEKKNIKRNVFFIIDTGSPCTYMTEEAFGVFNIKKEDCPHKATISINGSKILVGFSAKHHENVNLLGADFFALREAQLMIDYGKHTIKLVMM